MLLILLPLCEGAVIASQLMEMKVPDVCLVFFEPTLLLLGCLIRASQWQKSKLPPSPLLVGVGVGNQFYRVWLGKISCSLKRARLPFFFLLLEKTGFPWGGGGGGGGTMLAFAACLFQLQVWAIWGQKKMQEIHQDVTFHNPRFLASLPFPDLSGSSYVCFEECPRFLLCLSWGIWESMPIPSWKQKSHIFLKYLHWSISYYGKSW